jgi:hypothetical protein
MNAPYTYGEDYFNNFRTFQGLDYGYELKSRIDNNKVSVVNELDVLTLNRKNLNVYLSPSQTIEYDIWRQSSNLQLTFGTMAPQTGVTFQEFSKNIFNIVIKNSNTIKYERHYFNLTEVFKSYMETASGYTPYEYTKLLEYIEKMSSNWVKIIEQFIPSTTLWKGGVLINNNKLNRSKFKYYKPNYGSTTWDSQKCYNN